MRYFESLKRFVSNLFNSNPKRETLPKEIVEFVEELPNIEPVVEEDFVEEPNLNWQRSDCENRVASLVEYFCQCIKKDRTNPTILEHVNRILAYKDNLQRFFDGGSPEIYGGVDSKEIYWFDDCQQCNYDVKENVLNVKIFAILMELLSSENIYKKHYVRWATGLHFLKSLFRQMYNKKIESTNGLLISDAQFELFLSQLFDTSNCKQTYTLNDFFAEYEDLLKLNVSNRDYYGSLIDYDFGNVKKLNFPFAVTYIDIFEQHDSNNTNFNYTEMYDEEKFAFLMNYLIASYPVKIQRYILENLSFNWRSNGECPFKYSSRYAARLEQGHQSTEDYTIPGQIISVKTVEENASKTGRAFDYDNFSGGDRDIILHGNYIFSVVTDDKEYNLYDLFCSIKEPTFRNRATFDSESLSMVGSHLSLDQLAKILELIEKMIFDENGLLNVLNYKKFICNITMFELLNECRKDSDNYYVVKRMLGDLTQKIATVQINYFEEIPIKREREFGDLLTALDKFDGELLAEKVLSDGIYFDDDHNIMGHECRKMAAILSEKFNAFHATKKAAFEQLKKVYNNIDNLSHLDAEAMKKYTELLYKMTYSTDMSDDSKTL